MILSSHGIVASQIASFDADAVAFFNRVTTAGGSLSLTEKQAVNQLVLDLKANSLWTPMKAIYPMVGASAAACAQNLKSSSFTGTFYGGVTFASTGIKGNGTTGYMDTFLNVNTSLTLDSTHLSFYSRTNVLEASVEMGVTGASNTYLLYKYSDGNAYSGINGPQVPRPTAATPTTGFLIGSRTTSTEEKYYTNNVSQTLTSTSSSKQSKNLYLLAYNNLGFSQGSTKECAFASIGDGLTATDASNFYTAIQAFQTTLSRNL
jgi:hypothetical protein